MELETKLKHKKTGYVQYEIRFKTSNGTQGIAVVGLDGWDHDKGERRNNPDNVWYYRSTKGNEVRLSMNGPCWFTLSEMNDLMSEIDKCYLDLHTNYFESKEVDR